MPVVPSVGTQCARADDAAARRPRNAAHSSCSACPGIHPVGCKRMHAAGVPAAGYWRAAACFWGGDVGGVGDAVFHHGRVVVAVRIRDRRHLVLGLAAGVMLGVVAFDLMPEALEQSRWVVFGAPVAMLTAVGGFLTIHVVERSLALHRGSYCKGTSARTTVGAVGRIDRRECVGDSQRPRRSRHRRRLPGRRQCRDRRCGRCHRARLRRLFYFVGFLLYIATRTILPEAHARHPSRVTLLLTVAGATFIWLVVGLGR